ncbi:MAG: metal-dependent hydrolase, partial [Gemmatimonadaceae bacterium]
LRSRGSRNVPWRWLLAACAVAVVSHPWLDWLNTYGVRLLMPFSDRWFYGDTLFIVDLVMLVLLGGGWFVASRRRARGESRAERPARLAVSLVLLYIALMKVQSERSRDAVERALGMAGAGPHTLMIAPLPISVRTRSVLVAADSSYVERRVRAGLARVTLSDTSGVVITHAKHPLSVAAREREDWRRFAAWTRFPYFVPAPDGDSGVVFIGDARYASGSARTWAGLHVQLR